MATHKSDHTKLGLRLLGFGTLKSSKTKATAPTVAANKILLVVARTPLIA